MGHMIAAALAHIGVDTGKFSPHSVRSTSASASLSAGASIQSVLKMANWTNVGTFQQYYDCHWVSPPSSVDSAAARIGRDDS
jgi:site-specific recombinase XerD